MTGVERIIVERGLKTVSMESLMPGVENLKIKTFKTDAETLKNGIEIFTTLSKS